MLLSTTNSTCCWFACISIVWHMLKNRVWTRLSRLVSSVIHLSKLCLMLLLKFSLLLNVILMHLLLTRLIVVIQTSARSRTIKQKWLWIKFQLTFIFLNFWPSWQFLSLHIIHHLLHLLLVLIIKQAFIAALRTFIQLKIKCIFNHLYWIVAHHFRFGLRFPYLISFGLFLSISKNL